MSENENDDMLFEILKKCKTLPKFLDQIFGFLNRQTDFYYIAEHDNASVGLPEGLAEALVKKTFEKWKSKNCDSIFLDENELPPVMNEEIVIEEVTEEDNKQMDKVDEDTPDKVQIGSSNLVSDLDKKLAIEVKPFFKPAESYNGAAFDNYCWSQTLTEIDIIVKLPENCNSKELNINILPNRIKIKLKDQILLEGQLCHKCKNNDALWSSDKNKLEIHLDKCGEVWWDCFITSEDRLDLTQLDCSRPFEELPEDAQAKIHELQWNQQRKRLGLPTSQQMKQQQILQKAWSAEGSPFSGPFDPTQVSFE